ncbi:MAG: phage late control D family protein [Deltaproteobacteria bacterium]|nr:phage late control D family protein [Deltaproteobacteria bacterium]MCW5806392.1 phage late control D family protein [Deltaproteobacteria bacterium]
MLVDGSEIPDSDFVSYTVERDMNQPDMATVTLSNQNDIHTTKMKIGATVEIKVGVTGSGGSQSESIFKGEINAVEPSFKGGETKKITFRALNKMHRLLRIRKSLTFTDKTDQQILNQVVGDAGLSLEWKHEKTLTYKHVYQHNLTDLEFVRMRAGRLGAYVWCEDTKLFVKEPDLSKEADPPLKLSCDKGSEIRSFMPRMSSASIVKKVTVKGWNPETKELITGEAEVASSPLGKETATAFCGDLGKEETFTVDHPIWSQEEAAAIAKGRLRDLNLTFITGECEITGNPKVKIGTVIEIESHAGDDKDPFNGKYFVMGLTHRHSMPKSKDGGYITIIKLARDAAKKK